MHQCIHMIGHLCSWPCRVPVVGLQSFCGNILSCLHVSRCLSLSLSRRGSRCFCKRCERHCMSQRMTHLQSQPWFLLWKGCREIYHEEHGALLACDVKSGSAASHHSAFSPAFHPRGDKPKHAGGAKQQTAVYTPHLMRHPMQRITCKRLGQALWEGPALSWRVL